MKVEKFYEEIGGDYKSALSRLMNDTLMEKFVIKFLSDKSFAELKSAVTEKKWEDAFRASHTLKGVSLNLAFAKLSGFCIVLTDMLRPENARSFNEKSVLDAFINVEKAYNGVISAINSNI